MHLDLHSTSAFLTFFFALSAAFGGIFAAVALWIARILKRGKPLVVTLPGVPGALATVRYRNLSDSQFTVKASDEGKTWVVDGRAAYPAQGIAASVAIVSEDGFNLVAPSKDHVTKEIQDGRYESVPTTMTVKDPKTGADKVVDALSVWAARARVWDPLLLWRSNRENDMEDLYSAQAEKDPWQVRMFPLMLLGILALVGALIFLVMRIVPILKGTGVH